MKARNTFSSAIDPADPAITLPLQDIQGDILYGLQKKHEALVFFSIVDPSAFRTVLANDISTHITSSKLVAKRGKEIYAAKANHAAVRIQWPGAVNVAFSAAGLAQLGVPASDISKMDDAAFLGGQLRDAVNLGDSESTWDPLYKQEIHGVFLVASETVLLAKAVILALEKLCGNSAKVLGKQWGRVRDGAEKGHEHFGFDDGLSQPAVIGAVPPSKVYPGVEQIKPGIILMGNDGDANSHRPSWATNGSYLVFRKLRQYVPELDVFLASKEANEVSGGLSDGAIGARMMGRWKSGAPTVLAPIVDNPDMGRDPRRNNDFTYGDGKDVPPESNCPYAAHLRKANPRSGPPMNLDVSSRRMIRTGIPYGPEVSREELATQKTQEDRGLMFICYQSSVMDGFHFVQTQWANKEDFPTPPSDLPPKAGFDPIIGQNSGNSRYMTGLRPGDPTVPLPMASEFVVANGGEYFFSPSLPTIKNCFGLVTN